MSWIWPVVATLVASSGALMGSGLVLWLGRLRPPSRRRESEKSAPFARSANEGIGPAPAGPIASGALNGLLAVAVGTLLGAALLDLLPEALEHAPPKAVLWRFLLGIFAFLAFERLVRWRHTHEDHHHDIAAAAPLVLWSDALHNLVDGFVIGAAFTGGMELGVATTLAVIAHEIPQEVGDFAVLLGAGMPWRKALLLNWLVQLPPVPAAGITFIFASEVSGAVAWLLPLAAGSLVYIALADLVPSLHHRAAGRAALLQLALVAVGVALIAAVGAIGHA